MLMRDIDYRADADNLCGYLVFDETIIGRRPGVLVFHEGLGLGDFAMARARRLAELGYVALAADDPLAPPEPVAAFENEMRAAEVRD